MTLLSNVLEIEKCINLSHVTSLSSCQVSARDIDTRWSLSPSWDECSVVGNQNQCHSSFTQGKLANSHSHQCYELHLADRAINIMTIHVVNYATYMYM